MPRLKNDRTGVVVNVDDATAARLRAGSDQWSSSDTKAPMKKSASTTKKS